MATTSRELDSMIQKVEASLLPAIQEHVTSSEFSAEKHDLDYLHTKNTLLLSYLIDFTLMLRNRWTDTDDQANIDRLVEMRTILDKIRNLDKKLRYQIDKLLSASSTTFATQDPLQYRPQLGDDDEEEVDHDEEGTEEEEVDGLDDEGSNASDDDDQVATARETMASNQQTSDELYQAPRTTAVPYTQDKEDRRDEREKRQRRRLRASELAQTLRGYGDAPEQDDTGGGAGALREASRRMADREAEKTRFEEDQMVRLVTTRKEKKERRRLRRAEESNLVAISDLGNLVRDASFGREKGDDDEEEEERFGVLEQGRHSSGKRKKQVIDSDGRALVGKKRFMKAKNSYQVDLFGGGSTSSKKKKRR